MDNFKICFSEYSTSFQYKEEEQIQQCTYPHRSPGAWCICPIQFKQIKDSDKCGKYEEELLQHYIVSRDSVVGKATVYGLDRRWVGVWVPVEAR